MHLVQRCHQESEIAWTIVPTTGGWRTFEGQKNLVSDAGNGESVHHYGYAVDLTVKGLAWIAPNLEIQKAPIGFGSMVQQSMVEFYVVRNVVATALKLYSTIKGGDLGHLQHYDDDSLDSVGSLMALMELVGRRKMKWTPRYRKPTDYLCDLGLGGEQRYVGTAHDIWTKDQKWHISPRDLATLLQAKLKTDPKSSPDEFLGRSKTLLPEDFAESDINAADIKAVQAMLRAEFEAAETNWKRWRPVIYPNKDRRELNPRKQ